MHVIKNQLIIILTTQLYFLVFLILVQSKGILGHRHDDFKLRYQWKQMEYKFRSEKERSEAIKNGTFNVGKLQPIDAQYTYDRYTGRERIFITTPRLDPTGYPATLGVITNKSRNGNPIIDPYPSWSWHLNVEKCKYHRIVSVFRVWADECNRLWVIDNGVVGSNFSCPPQLLAFDLKTDKLLHKYEIPYDQYQNNTWYLTPLAEVESKRCACENTWVYVAAPVGPALLVYSLKQNTSWRIQDKSFKFDPNYTRYTIAGDAFEVEDTFEVEDGIITVALSPASDGLERKLRYHSMSNIRESWVYVRHLKNRNNFKVPYGSPELFYTYRDKRNQQSITEVVDRRGNVYFSLLIDIELVKWNPKTRYIRANFQTIADNPETTQFPTGLKISPYKTTHYDVLWMFTTAFQRWAAGTLNGNKTNFRLFSMILRE